MPIKTSKIFNKKRVWAGLLLAQFLLFLVFSKIGFCIKFFEHFFEFQKAIHQKTYSWLPISIGDLFYLLLGALIIFFIIKIFKKASRNHFSLNFLILLNIIYFVYQLFWGMLYFQTPILEKLPKGEISLETTQFLTLKYLELCKTSRKLVKEDKNGVFKVYDLNKIEAEILENQKHIPKFITNKKATEINSFKPSFFKKIMSDTGILGYYNPFTAEAQYNPNLPSSYLPFTLAHESSHQFGFAREQEANFIGYLVGKDAKNMDLKYSTEYFVLKSLLNSLVEKNPEFVKQVLKNYSEGMKKDRLYEHFFTKRHEGFLDVFFGFTNNFFLKTNQQEGSVTYSYFVDLMSHYEVLQPKK